jgi:nucleotide-binding universal stress UspA family protein
MPQFTEMRRPALWDDYWPSGAETRRRAAERSTVVLGYDGSQAARRALDRAIEAAGGGGHVAVVTAVQPADPLASEPGQSPTAEAALRLLDEAAALLKGHDARVSTRVEEAEPAEALAEAARSVNAVLIVIGARGDSFLARALRGSVGEKLIARAPCDLLVVR